MHVKDLRARWSPIRQSTESQTAQMTAQGVEGNMRPRSRTCMHAKKLRILTMNCPRAYATPRAPFEEQSCTC
eukprot:6186559-Pleurochrysis_carterae.AAC.7